MQWMYNKNIKSHLIAYKNQIILNNSYLVFTLNNYDCNQPNKNQLPNTTIPLIYNMLEHSNTEKINHKGIVNVLTYTPIPNISNILYLTTQEQVDKACNLILENSAYRRIPIIFINLLNENNLNLKDLKRIANSSLLETKLYLIIDNKAQVDYDNENLNYILNNINSKMIYGLNNHIIKFFDTFPNLSIDLNLDNRPRGVAYITDFKNKLEEYLILMNIVIENL